jgi:hypothetical protein
MQPARPRSYPPALQHQVRRASRLAHCLARFVEGTQPGEPTFVWAVGRADEVRMVVGAALREWSDGRLDAVRAADRIHAYAQELEESLEAWERSSRVDVIRPRNDTLPSLSS